MKKIYLALPVVAGLIFTGCATKQPEYVGASNPDTKQIVTMGIDRQDFERAADEAINSLLASGALNKQGGGRYVVAMGRIKNDTTQRIDTDLLTKKIRIAMLNSGKAVITTAASAGGAEDDMTYEVRKLRENAEFNQGKVAKQGAIIAPDFSLSGKIIQQIARTADNKQLTEYYFQLTLTDVNSGLAFWEGESIVGKLGSNETVTW